MVQPHSTRKGACWWRTSNRLLAVTWDAIPQVTAPLHDVPPLIPCLALGECRGQPIGEQIPDRIQGRAWRAGRNEAHEARADVTCPADKRPLPQEARARHVPIDGPPRTRIISLLEPPSSETGRTWLV